MSTPGPQIVDDRVHEEGALGVHAPVQELVEQDAVGKTQSGCSDNLNGDGCSLFSIVLNQPSVFVISHT